MRGMNSQMNYRSVIAFRKSDVIYEGTVVFCRRFLNETAGALEDRMMEAARSSCRLIKDCCLTPDPTNPAGTDLAAEARVSLTTLIEGYESCLKGGGFTIWSVGDERFIAARAYAHSHNDWSDWTQIFEHRPPECLANLMLTICHQTRFLLGKLIDAHERGVAPRRDPFEKGLYGFLASSANPGALAEKVEELKREISRISWSLRRKHGWVG